MKLQVVLVCVLAVICFAYAEEEPAQRINPPNWHGTWTANNRYGGVMYSCPVGNRLYGVYSNAGFFMGLIDGDTVEGNWYEGGRGDRNNWQGSFKIKISPDNQEFDGFFHRVSQDGTEIRWHETRLGAPYPSSPSHLECLVPSREPLLGSFYRRRTSTASSSPYHICHDPYGQVYGSFLGPDGYLEGWSVDSATGFHGYRYDSNGRSGAYILRSVSPTEVRGYYWRDWLVAQNIETAQEEVLDRSSYTVSLSACETVGRGFLERLRGPAEQGYNQDTVNGAESLSISIVLLLVTVFLFL